MYTIEDSIREIKLMREGKKKKNSLDDLWKKIEEWLMQNPCDKCIHQLQSWNTDPCYKCGSENGYPYCEDADGNLLQYAIMTEKQRGKSHDHRAIQ